MDTARSHGGRGAPWRAIWNGAEMEDASPVVRLYDSTIPSGNGYKVRLLLAHLGCRYERVLLDILKGETRTPAYLAKNPNGKIPLVELEDGTFLSESNAILAYLAEGTPYWPTSRIGRARCLQWMFFEQYSHEPNIATSRFWYYAGLSAGREAALADKQKAGHAALATMALHLERQAFFAGDRYSIADIALYAYTHVAEEGRFDLAPYPAIRAWLERVRTQPGHVAMT
jgi:glutathione S-transferase